MATKRPIASRPHMPGYGVAAQDEGPGLLPWSWASERLMAARNYFITTVRPDGRPHVMVVWGLWMDDTFVFSTSGTSVKARNLGANPRCVIAPGDADNAVIVEGVASKLDNEKALARFVADYKTKYDWDLAARTEPVWVVRPTVVFGQIEETFTSTATRWRFD